MRSSRLHKFGSRFAKPVGAVALAGICSLAVGCSKEVVTSTVDSVVTVPATDPTAGATSTSAASETTPVPEPAVPSGPSATAGSPEGATGSGASGASGIPELPPTTAGEPGPSSAEVDAAPLGITIAATGANDIKIDTTAVAPTEAQSWIVQAAEDGCQVVEGDTATIAYKMAMWKDGSVVEEATADTALSVPVNLSGDPSLPPVALRSALVDSRVGSRLGVLFPAGLTDLPGYFATDTAYVLSVDVLGSEKCSPPK